MKSEVIPFRLPVTEAAAIRGEAKAAGRSLSDLIRERIQKPTQSTLLPPGADVTCARCISRDERVRKANEAAQLYLSRFDEGTVLEMPVPLLKQLLSLYEVK